MYEQLEKLSDAFCNALVMEAEHTRMYGAIYPQDFILMYVSM